MWTEKYIELEKIRFQDTLRVIFLSDEIDETIEVAPMLLIPFVENAFKHGNLVDGFLQVEIHIKISENSLQFLISNSFKNEGEAEMNAGLGLNNIKKRLELNYPDNYSLNNEKSDNLYKVELTIGNLNELQNGYFSFRTQLYQSSI